ATISGISWGMNDLKEPPEKTEIIKEAIEKEKKVYEQYNEGLLTAEERYDRSIVIWQEVKRRVDEFIPTALDPYGSVYSIVSSAARGSWSQVAQMSGMKGLVFNPANKIIDFPITSSYKKGLDVLEYFISTHGARKGTADTALKTAKAGYLTRRLVDVAQDVIVTEDDCGTKEGLVVIRQKQDSYDKEMTLKLKGRVLAKKINHKNIKLKAGHLMNLSDAKAINDANDIEEVFIRSPLKCQSRSGVCSQCYGVDLSVNKLVKQGEAVGIIAAQAIGEPGTQLTMRTFHTGGIASKGGDITSGLPRVEELFEIRTPANSAVVSKTRGTVIEIRKEEKDSIITVLPDPEDVKDTAKLKKLLQAGEKIIEKDKKKTEVIEYFVPFGKRILVKLNQEVKAGDPLSEGPIDVKDLFKLAGTEAAQDYILKEVGRVYSIQAVAINEKHLEVIIRQMFSRYKIKSAGDTNFSIGKIVERTALLNENEIAKNNGGKEAEAKRVIMGMTKVSLSTSSFLSAASFQDTARVLITTATEGGKDILHGLKENVIIGRLIPAGTGYRHDLEITKSKANEPEPGEEEKEEEESLD
ncbi:DNA-directed RNA polymerase subunit beta', partial [Patescibacteria group bacterium]